MKQHYFASTLLFMMGLFLSSISQAQGGLTLLSQYAGPGPNNAAYIQDGISYFNGSNRLYITDNTPNNPTILGTYDMTAPILSMKVEGDYMYTTDINGLFNILNISDASNVSQLDFVPIVSSTPETKMDIVIDGDYAYIANYDLGVTVIDISDPTNASLVGTYEYEGDIQFLWYEGITKKDNHLLVTIGDYFETFKLIILDATDPQNLTFVGETDISDWPYGVAVKGNNAYVASTTAGLTVIDITDPTAPSATGNLYVGFGWDKHVSILDDYAYVAADDGQLKIFDISTPNTLSHVSSYNSQGDSPLYMNIVSDGTYAYLSGESAGLEVVDISTPQAPQLSHFGIPENNGYASGINYKDGHVYLADGLSGLAIFNVEDPENPQLINRSEVPSWSLQVHIDGDYAYVTSTRGMHIFDISEPANATFLGEYMPGNVGHTAWARGLTVRNDTCFLAFQRRGIIVLDVSDKTNPRVISTYVDAPKKAYDIEIQGNLAFVQYSNERIDDDNYSHLSVLDISDVSNFTEVGNWTGTEIYGAGNAMQMNGNQVYLADNNGMYVLDVSDPTDPSLDGVWEPNNAYYIDASDGGDFMFVAKSNAGVKVVDVRNPNNPTTTGGYNTSGTAEGVAVNEDLVYVADGDGGLVVLRHEFVDETVYTEEENEGGFRLAPNYPNPFSAHTNIPFTLTEGGHVKLSVLDQTGRELKVLVDEEKATGDYTVTFDAETLPSGIYFYQLTTNSKKISKKMIMVQ